MVLGNTVCGTALSLYLEKNQKSQYKILHMMYQQFKFIQRPEGTVAVNGNQETYRNYLKTVNSHTNPLVSGNAK